MESIYLLLNNTRTILLSKSDINAEYYQNKLGKNILAKLNS